MSAVDALQSSSAEGGRRGETFGALARGLSEARGELALEVVALRTVDSTNRLARRLVERVGDELRPFLVVAWQQTAGRGRGGRSWSSPGGLGAYQSLVQRAWSRAAVGLAPLRVGVALCDILRPLAPEIVLKWPNDLVTPRGKLGGILIELLGTGEAATLVVGYGVNVGHHEAELPLASATSIRLENGGHAPRLGELVPRMAIAVRGALDAEEPAARTLERYREVAAHRPGDRLGCTLGGERFEGRLIGFDQEGRLVLETESGRRALSAADAVETVPPGAGR